MTGPEHFREAERLIGSAVRQKDGTFSADWEAAAVVLQLAQVHATLALAAAAAIDIEERIDVAIRAHVEDAPHIYPDGSTS